MSTPINLKYYNMCKLDGQGKARREAARRRNSECKINLDSRNSSHMSGNWQMTPKAVSQNHVAYGSCVSLQCTSISGA